MRPGFSSKGEKPSFCLRHRGTEGHSPADGHGGWRRLPRPRAPLLPSLCAAPGSPRRRACAVFCTRAGGHTQLETTPSPVPSHLSTCTQVHAHTCRSPMEAGGDSLALILHLSRTGNASLAHFGSANLVLPYKHCKKDSCFGIRDKAY